MFTIGLDFGTNSVRALVVRCSDGAELATAVVPYASGLDGIFLNPADHNLARQHPADWLAGAEAAIREALARASECNDFSPAMVIGIGVDGTGSSPLPVDSQNRPLADDPRFSGNPNALCWLWKDHTAIDEAERITETARELRPQYLAKIGGTYSSEWFWAKIWHCLNTDPDVFHAAHSWVELADYIPAVLAGVVRPADIVRGVCMAGHKALYAEDWGGLPDAAFLSALDPRLAELLPRLYQKAVDASSRAGSLCPEWAAKLGLPAGIAIAVGEMDVHYGAIGCGVDEGTLVKVIGTSSCDCAVVSADRHVPDIPGICGIVKGAILPGYFGIEAGQSAVGDIFKWFVEGICEGDSGLHHVLTDQAAALRPGQSGLMALDWNNGNRNVLVNPRLTGLLIGQTLHTSRAEIYRALIEATAFGARAIIERIVEFGVPVRLIVCSGGIAAKNPFLMQIYADVTGCEMRVSRSDQACALGAAIGAAVCAGAHPDFATAQSAMTGLKDAAYRPIPENQAVYQELYRIYRSLHDAFGAVTPAANLGQVMKELLRIKNESIRTM